MISNWECSDTFTLLSSCDFSVALGKGFAISVSVCWVGQAALLKPTGGLSTAEGRVCGGTVSNLLLFKGHRYLHVLEPPGNPTSIPVIETRLTVA